MKTDKTAIELITSLTSIINDWRENNQIEQSEIHLTSYSSHYDSEPFHSNPVLVMNLDGYVAGDFSGYYHEALPNDLYERLENTGFFFEHSDSTSVHFYIESNDIHEKAIEEYNYWLWLKSLIKNQYTEMYEEIFNYFGKYPERLQKLHWREFEKFLSEIYTNLGYKTRLGPGKGDGGVDLTIISQDPLADTVSLLQAKKYDSKYPIRQDAISAILGHVQDRKADKGIFATTSRYLPSAKDFANRNNIELLTSSELSEMSIDISKLIVRDKSKLFNEKSTEKQLEDYRLSKSEIYYNTYGYNCTDVDFYLLLKKSKSGGIFQKIGSKIYKSDIYKTIGSKLPHLSKEILNTRSQNTVFRAKKNESERYWGREKLLSKWNSTPVNFNLMD